MLDKIQRVLPIEVIVVDNHSSERSAIESISKAFPSFRFVWNSENLGFGAANNIGVSHAQSDHILILNPDTIISEELILQGIQYLEDKTIGAVAYKMVDGRGDYLPESRRGFPSLIGSFYKLIGLGKLFPQSKILNQYYLGSQSSKDYIEVMAGACFMMRKFVYDELGGFDERFFMYGEDIDMSYQLFQRGYHIRYIDDCPIVHFKGRSSPKTHWKYQTDFYNAMMIYWKKNFQSSKSILNRGLMSLLIWGLKILSYIKHLISAWILPVVDGVTIYLFIAALSHIWAVDFKRDVDFFPVRFYTLILPLYTIVWIGSLYIANFYQRKIELLHLFKGMALGSLCTLVLYFVLPSEYKFSRGVLIASIAIKTWAPLFIRYILQLLHIQKIYLGEADIFTASFPDKFNQIKFTQILQIISNYKWVESSPRTHSQVIDIAQVSNKELITQISSQNGRELWLYSESGQYLIQSHGQYEDEYILAEDKNLLIRSKASRWVKRTMDCLISIGVILINLPRLVLYYASATDWIQKATDVLSRDKTWISVSDVDLKKKLNLRDGIYHLNALETRDSQIAYLRNYSATNEMIILLRYMIA